MPIVGRFRACLLRLNLGAHSSGMNAFVQQLHHRKVGRAVAIYVPAAFLAVVVAGFLFPEWDLPNWSLPALIIVVLAAFPVVLGYAWHYNITADGAKRTFAPELAGPTSAIPVIVAGILFAVTTAVLTVPRAHNFMATAKPPPTDLEVSRKVKEVLNRFTHYPGGAQNIPGAAKLHGAAGPHETSLGLDPITDASVIASLNSYIHEFQPGHQIDQDEYGEKKTVLELIELVRAKVKPDPPKPSPRKSGKGGLAI
jgi:hypothetical protein